MESVVTTEQLPVAQFRTSIMQVQEELAQLPQLECPVFHHFAPGSYARECHLPEGSLVIGKIHKHAHINVISRGRVSVMTEDGRKDLQAPCTFVSLPGTKRAVYAHEYTVWTTVHVTNNTDLDAIEAEIIVPSYDELAQLESAQQLLAEVSQCPG